MDNSTPSKNANNDGASSSSYFQRTVSLYNWWLVKAENDFEGKRLAVAGLTSRDGEAVRVFVSTPIVKRHDVFSLETADGIYLLIRGFINQQRTTENGFPSEVFNHFLFGFPINWECYAVNCFEEELTTGTDSGETLTSAGTENGPEILSNEKSYPTCIHALAQEETSRDHEKQFPETMQDVIQETGVGNSDYGNVCYRRSARVQNIKICQLKKSASALKHPDKQPCATSGAMENPDGEKPKSPVTPVQLLGEIDKLSEQHIGESPSGTSRTLPSYSQDKTKRGTKSKRKMTMSVSANAKRKMTKSISVDAKADSISLRRTNKRLIFDTNRCLMTTGSKKKMSTVSPESLGFRRSRSGRLLLPPLEFWRNQMPIYNAEHEVTEIQQFEYLASSQKA